VMLPVRASTTFSGSVAWAGASGQMVFSLRAKWP